MKDRVDTSFVEQQRTPEGMKKRIIADLAMINRQQRRAVGEALARQTIKDKTKAFAQLFREQGR